jgi:hypothetical protein
VRTDNFFVLGKIELFDCGYYKRYICEYLPRRITMGAGEPANKKRSYTSCPLRFTCREQKGDFQTSGSIIFIRFTTLGLESEAI